MLSDFHFLRPYWFYSFIPTFILIFYILKYQNFNNIWSKYCDKNLLDHLVKNKSNSSNKFFYSLLILILILTTFILAGPTWSMSYHETFSKNTARVIALDVSSSMDSTDLQPSRMERAKFKVLDLLKKLNEGQTGMVVFSSEAFVVSPLTSDSNTIANMIPVVNTDIVPVKGSNIGKALMKSYSLIRQAGFSSGKIILITDSVPDTETMNIATSLINKGISISIIGVGSLQGAPALNNNGSFTVDNKGGVLFNKLDEGSLIALSHKGNGIYETLSYNDNDIDNILSYNKSLDSTYKNSSRSQSSVLWNDQGCLFVWFLLFLIVIISRKGWLSKLC